MLVQPVRIPHTPGIYIFRQRKNPIYIGKAADLKKRLISYWQKNAGQKVEHLLAEATSIRWIETLSETDALLKEAALIKQHIPKYNIVMRDDKNYFYVGITKEQFPRIFLTHQPQSYETRSHKIGAIRYIGPFTSGSALKSTLRLLRRIFPYCICKKPHKRPCLNAQIGRCPGYCCIQRNVPTTERRLASWNIQYGKNIKNITAVLSSKKKRLTNGFKRQMRGAALKQDFEEAAKLRDQIAGIENIFSHERLLEVRSRSNRDRTSTRLTWHKIERTIQGIFRTKHKISRVEGYDISNISGTEATGSMVVFIDGIPVKSEYRKFKINMARPSAAIPVAGSDLGTVNRSDVDMLKEVIRRRIRHMEWKFPDLMLIDGGKPQLNAVASVIRHRILLSALAKKEEELYIISRLKPIRLDALPSHTAFFFQRVRDESHRFAKKYHHKLREIMFRLRKT